MNNLAATVSKIQKCDSLHIVYFDFNDIELSMMSLELHPNIQVGKKVKLSVKSSHIAIAKNFLGEVSYSNKLLCTISNISNGELLSCVELKLDNIFLESIITLNSSKKMDLKIGDEVTIFIKASELSICELIDE